MEFKTEQVSEITIVVIPGEALDANMAPDFKRDVAPILEASKKVAFDMSELQFLDSSGLGAVLSCLRKLESAGGELKLFGLTKPVRALFELVRMHRIFDIFNSRDEAVAAF